MLQTTPVFMTTNDCNSPSTLMQGILAAMKCRSAVMFLKILERPSSELRLRIFNRWLGSLDIQPAELKERISEEVEYLIKVQKLVESFARHQQCLSESRNGMCTGCEGKTKWDANLFLFKLFLF